MKCSKLWFAAGTFALGFISWCRKNQWSKVNGFFSFWFGVVVHCSVRWLRRPSLGRHRRRTALRSIFAWTEERGLESEKSTFDLWKCVSLVTNCAYISWRTVLQTHTHTHTHTHNTHTLAGYSLKWTHLTGSTRAGWQRYCVCAFNGETFMSLERQYKTGALSSRRVVKDTQFNVNCPSGASMGKSNTGKQERTWVSETYWFLTLQASDPGFTVTVERVIYLFIFALFISKLRQSAWVHAQCEARVCVWGFCDGFRS